MHKLTLCTCIIGFLFNFGRCQLFGMSNADHALLESAVKQIVHPAAFPTQGMYNIANRHGAPPSNIDDVMEYVPHMQYLAHQLGVKPAGSKGPVAPHVLDQYIQNRAAQWYQQYVMRGGGRRRGLFGGGNNWLMNMFFFDQFI